MKWIKKLSAKLFNGLKIKLTYLIIKSTANRKHHPYSRFDGSGTFNHATINAVVQIQPMPISTHLLTWFHLIFIK